MSLIGNTEYDDYELIVVDNGSTDGTKEFLLSLSESNDIDKLILNKKNYGCGYATNEGFRLAEGDWIAYVQNDMMLSNIHGPCKNWLQIGIDLYNKTCEEYPNLKIGGVFYVDEDKNTLKSYEIKQLKDGTEFILKGIYEGSYNDHPSIMPRSVYKELGERSYGGNGPWRMILPHNENDYSNRFNELGFRSIKPLRPYFYNIGTLSLEEISEGYTWTRFEQIKDGRRVQIIEFNKIPNCRLSFPSYLTDEEWNRLINGENPLVIDLTIDRSYITDEKDIRKINLERDQWRP